MKLYAYRRTGLLAVNPSAFAELFAAMIPDRENETREGVEIVDICGPLVRHTDSWCDSYDAIRERFGVALAGAARDIVLRIDSPGGDATGCFELSRELRVKAAAAGKRLIAYIDGQACSAAYALACAGETIVVPATGFVGSIGVLSVREDSSAALAAQGVNVTFVTSGSRKADGQPFKAMSEAELAETQATVDSLAELFFELVQETRNVDAAPLEARQFHGAKAVSVGLADSVQTFDQLLASLAGATGAMNMVAKGLKSARDALGEAAKGDDEDARRARRALDALDAQDDAPSDDEPADEPDASDAPSDDKDEPAAAATSALAAQVQTLSTQLQAFKATQAATERAAFLSTRPDLAPELVASLAGLSLTQVKAIVATIAKPAAPSNAAATVVVPATQGAGVPGTPQLPAAQSTELRQRMGLETVASKGVVKTEHKLTLGAPVPVSLIKEG